MLRYKGYSAQIRYDESTEQFVGQVMHLNQRLVFEGRSVDELKNRLKQAVERYLHWCRQQGELPEKAYSGKLQLRIDPPVHQSLSLMAVRHGVSLNALICDILTEAVSQAGPLQADPFGPA